MNNIFREIKDELRLEKVSLLNYPPHLHSEIELVYVINGSVTAYLSGKRYPLERGCFFLSFPNQVHNYTDCSADCEAFLVIIKPSVLKVYTEIFTESLPASPFYRCEEDDSNIVKLLNIGLQESLNGAEKGVVLSILAAVFGILLKNYGFNKQSVSNNSILKIMKYCSSHYKEDISVEKVSKALYISRSHISHTFNNKLKISFSDYINSLRLTEAVRLINTGEYSITQTAYLSGFPTIRTFNRAFLKRYGVSPSQYRSKKQNNL